MRNTDKKAMPVDSVEALQALEKVVSAEQEMRSVADNGLTSGAAVSEVFFEAMSGGNDFTKGAVASQLIGSAVLHSQSELFANKKQIEEHAEVLCRTRLKGLCDDAMLLGRAYATASESASDDVSRKSMLEALNDLLEKMSQTEDLVWAVRGENCAENMVQKRTNTSALLCSFLSEIAVYNPNAASVLFAERKELLRKADAETVSNILLRSASDHAYSILLKTLTTDDPHQRVEELYTSCHETSPTSLNISEKSHSFLLERVEAERAQFFQIDTMLTAVKRRNAAREMCEFLVNGDRVQAVAVLYDSKLFPESDRQALLHVLRKQRWETKPERFVEAFASAVNGERDAEPYCVFPDEALAPYDVLLLYDVLEEYSPKIQFENERLLDLLERAQSKLQMLVTEQKIKYADADYNLERRGVLLDVTLLRYIFFSVISARKEDKDISTVLNALEKDVFC
ncbi:hypothetical protein [Halodesulfovibrio marinisediminis]|uniref:Uncharacterized protein n=1 Tax=Halodesulfovibrio marinisediminis DSM 17456 TaxID=1121457 RepID=A0A1N6IY33_9BACT|nr:hypothetical protein [Halodesulfovibrio marinisediminis]SIO36903.1 hypothetical protein SAMN02745161_3042 [Halodesulfovibrio marinisediminis DSM 17456]